MVTQAKSIRRQAENMLPLSNGTQGALPPRVVETKCNLRPFADQLILEGAGDYILVNYAGGKGNPTVLCINKSSIFPVPSNGQRQINWLFSRSLKPTNNLHRLQQFGVSKKRQ
ncbi:hypothetical protein M758_2G097700 [Ceratodon purpureus]|nr:hypothetical protein M758_2G097700 [Ceratodon purpureus]